MSDISPKAVELAVAAQEEGLVVQKAGHRVMVSDWPLRPLAEISVSFDTKRKPVKEVERVAGPYPYYGASGIIGYVDDYLFDGEYLLVAEDGENLRTRNTPIAFRADGKFWVNNHAHIIQGNKNVSTRYLEYALLAADITPYLTGAVMPKLTQGNLNKIELPCPSLEEQRAIAEILGTFDDRIDNLRQTNATLEAIAAALFKSWFVDFDGVLPEDMQESKLGLIPKGWRVDSFDKAIEILGGGTPKTSTTEYWSGDIPWFSVVDAPAKGQVFVLDTEKKITALGLQNCSAKLLPEMSTIISARGTVGKVAMTGVPMAMNQSCYALRPKQQDGEAFVYFSTLRFVEHLKRIAHGAVFDTITRDSFKQITACLPTDASIAEFGKIANPLLARIRANGQQVATLTNLRDTLLPRLISGRLRLGETAS